MANTTGHKNKVEETSNPNFPGQRPQDPGSTFGEKAREAASAVGEKARDAASSVADKAREAASSVAGTASGLASSAGHKIEDATSAVGSGMKSLAGTIREKAPHSGMMGSASSSVAEGLESGGRYLQEHGLGGIAEDVTNLVRRNPIPALFVGIGLGFLLARATRS
jgi:hypothetical protein